MFEEYVNSASFGNLQILKIADLAEGETLARIRFNWQAIHSVAGPFNASGFAVAFGILVVPAGTDPEFMPHPYEQLDADWLWWEAPIYQSQLGADSDGVVVENDMAPAVTQYRDARAMRKADVGGSDVYIQSQTSFLSSAQSDHYLTFTGSLLVLLAA